jgi:putative intracellular protease/amidase
MGKLHGALDLLVAPRRALRMFRLIRKARRERWLTHTESLRALEARFGARGLVSGFDAVVVPSGQGEGLRTFLTDPLLHEVLLAAALAGKIVALQCQAVAAGALARHADGRPLLEGHAAVCWPGAYESALGALPLVGGYFQPLGRPVQTILEKEGIRVAVGARLPHVVVDGNLVTSLGPSSAEALGAVLVDELTLRVAERAAARRAA